MGTTEALLRISQPSGDGKEVDETKESSGGCFVSLQYYCLPKDGILHCLCLQTWLSLGNCADRELEEIYNCD